MLKERVMVRLLPGGRARAVAGKTPREAGKAAPVTAGLFCMEGCILWAEGAPYLPLVIPR